MRWAKVKLGDLVVNFSIKGKTVKNFESLPFYGVSNETGITTSKYAAEDKAEDYKVLEKGCFAYNPYRVNVGSIAYLDSDETGLISSAYVVFKAKEKSIVPELLLRFLKSTEGLRQIKLYARGTVRQALRFEDLCKIELCLPNYEEQLDFYSTYLTTETKADSLLKEQTHQLKLLKKLRQQILQDAVQGKLVRQDPNDEPASVLLERIKAEKEKLVQEGIIKKEKPLLPIKQEEIPFAIPENWVWCRFGNLGNCRLGKMLDVNKNKGDYVNYIRNTNVQWKYVDLSDIKKLRLEKHEIEEYKLLEGDLLICEGGVPGRCAIWKAKEEYFAFQKAIHRFRSNGSMLTELVEYYLEYSFNNKFLRQYFTGNQIKHLTGQSLETVLIPVPPINEQHRIVIQIKHLLKLCDEMEKEIQHNRKFTQELVHVALKEALEPNII